LEKKNNNHALGNAAAGLQGRKTLNCTGAFSPADMQWRLPGYAAFEG